MKDCVCKEVFTPYFNDEETIYTPQFTLCGCEEVEDIVNIFDGGGVDGYLAEDS